MDSVKTSQYVLVSEKPLDLLTATEFVSSPSAGATSVFVGVHLMCVGIGKKVIHLEYEAYVAMAEKEMCGICRDTFAKWPDIQKIALMHRIGVVPLKEASVIVAASSAHRKEAIEAVHYVIDEVKRRVPIWKKELYEGGDSIWKENSEWKRN
eukprot:m.63999 g.63999  ORF g.63999 m.63999 type:complete len:152 (+) comp35210_c0_seq4:293-748(+)